MTKNTQLNFIEVIADEGKFLTFYQEGQDIKEFNYFTKGCFPLEYNFDLIREIEAEEKDELEAAKIAAEEEAAEAE